MATFIELDAWGPNGTVTVAEVEVRDGSSPEILEVIARQLAGRTIAQLKNDPGFSWWENPVTDDTVIVSAFVNRV